MWDRKCKLQSKIYCKYVHDVLVEVIIYENFLFHSFLFLDCRIVVSGLVKWFPLASCDVDTGRYP